jgi:hypothetical protein
MMIKAYGDPVDVQARDDGRPAGFVWRSRRYTVRMILEHWVIKRETGPGSPEFELWRVAASPASPAPGASARRYELRREAATGEWSLNPPNWD